MSPIDTTLFAEASYAFRASDGPMLSRSSLTPIYPASLSEVDQIERTSVQLLEDRDVSLSQFDRPEVLLCPDAIIVNPGDHEPRPIG